MSQFLLRPDQLLWHTRGKHWGYEFLCLPQSIQADWYQVVLQPLELTGGDGPQHFTVNLEGQTLVGIRRDDEQLCDHASRPVSHTAAWVLPDDVAREDVPANWFDQFYQAVRHQFSSEQFYGLPDEEVRQRWHRREPLGRSLRQELLTALRPVRIVPGPPPDSYTSLGAATTIEPLPKRRPWGPGWCWLALAVVAVVVSAISLARR